MSKFINFMDECPVISELPIAKAVGMGTNFIRDEGDIFFVVDESKLILDHINPIALGGAEFDESNLQILCWECNKIKTRKDHAEIAKARKLEKIMNYGQVTLHVTRS